MAGNIFLVSEDNKLTRMSPAAYEKELVLQELIEKYPEILDGTQIAPHQPARWICVGREIGVPDEEGGSARWSLDHLFLDQNAIPTFIEVKRSSDTRIRREVVGQMMDYAANGVVYWPVEELREIFERQCELVKGGTEAALREAFGSDIDEDAYWQQVKTNLRAGRVRMVFVADIIPRELQRIIEFLNEQMERAEVLGIEVRQFSSASLKTLVPRVIGATAQAEAAKGVTKKRIEPWTVQELLERMAATGKSTAVAVTRTFLAWAEKHGLVFAGGEGKKHASLNIALDASAGGLRLFQVYEGYKSGQLYFNLEVLQKVPGAEEYVRELFAEMNSIPDINLSDEKKWPAIPLDVLNDPANWDVARPALEAFVDGIRSAVIADQTDPRSQSR